MYLQVSKMPDERQHTAWEKSSDLRLRLVQTASTVMSWTSAVHKGKLKCGRIPPTIPTPFKEWLTYCSKFRRKTGHLQNSILKSFESKTPCASLQETIEKRGKTTGIRTKETRSSGGLFWSFMEQVETSSKLHLHWLCYCIQPTQTPLRHFQNTQSRRTSQSVHPKKGIKKK